VPTGTVDESGAAITKNVKFEIDQNVYTATEGTFTNNGEEIKLKGKDFTLTANNTIEYVEVDSTSGDETLAIRPNVVKLGNKFVHYTTDPNTGERIQDAEYDIATEERVADWKDTTLAKTFKVDDTTDFTGAGYVTVLKKDDLANTLSPGNVVWKIKYPSEGVQALDWPALPVEAEPEEDNHRASNHHSRNYWFAIEEVPTWSTEGYDNSKAVIPGEEFNDYYKAYKNSNWYASTKSDKDLGETLVHESYKNGNAYLSVFENGGEIVNVPSIVVRGVKEWDDLGNAYSTRQDIWMHIDVQVKNADGSTTEKKDVLPPQKIAANATGAGLQVQWGDKATYDTGDSAIEIAKTDRDVPSNAKKQADGSYLYRGVTYWVNELKKIDVAGNTYE
ncbi:MAG: hypothetical protein IJ131_09030, partial [Eggerthellaceae bacterium]|nr:hypothetical protein [Eggerthellaceae bacterium]